MKEAIIKAIEGGWEPVDFTDTPIENRGVLFYDDMPADGKDAEPGHVYFYDTDYPDEGWYAGMLMNLALLDPGFWKGLGQSMGWGNVTLNGSTWKTGRDGYLNVWQSYWHDFIDHVAEGKDIDSFFKHLLANPK